MPRKICGSTAFPIRRPAPGEVRVKIAAGGICGSDLHYYHHGGFGTVRIQQPMALGHEIAGVIAAVGGGVSHLTPGMRVAVNPSQPCGTCLHCREGMRNQCLDMRFMGSAMRMPHVQGGFREHVTVDASQAIPIAEYAVARRSRDGRAACGLSSRRQAGRPAARQARAGDRLRSDRRADGRGGALWRRGGSRRDRYRRRTARGGAQARREPHRQQCDGSRRARSLSRRQGRLRRSVRGLRQSGGAALRARSDASRRRSSSNSGSAAK